MFIELTNATPALSGKEIAVRKEIIVSVYRCALKREDDTIEEVTCVFVPPHGTWEVRESVKEVLELMK